ncbi:MAG: transcription antitermination factor NusB [Acidobacteria bacterium RIFCSPLOWO2_02_FULL_67_36]|nr:MAG: transcription antitermination factor NusB [Acidobacteria bacterium RIFCSPLOWO2_02_FULL_67_36]OFW22044.1 MAG: transcription antitermination factor NusB [Acidobacteria bacterium RIFCSPLOWO2_12_FULL_66_21]
MTRVDAIGRRRAREAALQMLYLAEVGRAGAHEAIATYWPSREPDEELAVPHREFAEVLLRGTLARTGEIDALLSAHAQNWRVERMAIVDRLVLRLAVYELLAEPDTPAKVVINEAIELARTYSGDEAIPFVNGVLDAVRKELKRE